MNDLQKLYRKINWSFAVCDFWLIVAKLFSFAVDKAEEAHQRSIELIKQIPEDKCSEDMRKQLKELQEIGLI